MATKTEKDVRVKNLQAAIAEAKKFIGRAEAAIEHLSTPDWVHEGKEYYPSTSRPYAAAKRTSLDLSQALLQVRKSGR